MKVGSLLSTLGRVALFFTALPLFSQKEIRIEKRYDEMDYAPQIQGIYNGEISFDKFCSAEGIVTRIGVQVLTFDLYYCQAQKEPVHIVGNEVPDSICANIKSYCLLTDVFISNIKAIDLDGSIKNLNPLHYFILPEEE
jgi:hypothetical protein